MMAEDLKQVANEIVDKVLDGVDASEKDNNYSTPAAPAIEPTVSVSNSTINSTTSEADVTVERKKSVLCVMICPNSWFNRQKLNPMVETFIYWEDPRKSAAVFGGVLFILLALTYVSVISVIAYLSLLLLTGTVAFKIYKNIVQAIQKTGDGHPFKQYLDLDISVSQDKAQAISQVVVAHLNAAIIELRRLLLVEDLVDSIKFGVLLWVLTYLGAWFNGMTVVIMMWVTLFTLPKVYEANQTQIDANLEIVQKKIAEFAAKIKSAIPVGKKGEKIE
ncbi:unnamed protein product [Ceutorhynchus assimilis]|uniref:Reticulon-like protein n=1 Tax=Ceutorhynchus assimilis TaxID=467358 RepID=A0A9N9MMF6_9CUCU|nr:unnamed protein product [Ceutorhynchus assimilis]